MDEREEYATKLEQESLADALKKLESLAEAAGGSPVTPTNYRDDAPSPFAVANDPVSNRAPVDAGLSRPMPSFDQRQEVEQQARQVAPPTTFGPDFDPRVQGNPFESGSGEVLQVLKDMLQKLQSIDEKLPQASTYQE